MNHALKSHETIGIMTRTIIVTPAIVCKHSQLCTQTILYEGTKSRDLSVRSDALFPGNLHTGLQVQWWLMMFTAEPKQTYTEAIKTVSRPL